MFLRIRAHVRGCAYTLGNPRASAYTHARMRAQLRVYARMHLLIMKYVACLFDLWFWVSIFSKYDFLKIDKNHSQLSPNIFYVSYDLHFISMLCILKMLLNIQGIFWYNLQHHTARRKGLVAVENTSCRFLENDIPGSRKFKFKISPFWRFFQKFSTSKCRRIAGNGSKMLRKRALDAPDIA